MRAPTDLIQRYVALWNEPDAGVRRQRIAALWAPDGATCYRQLESRGYGAIEARVTSAHDKWVRDGGYEFRSRHDALGHHGVVKFHWEMGRRGGEAVSVGLNVLILDADGRIRSDYQFGVPASVPAPREAEALVERYVALWNEPDPAPRRRRIAELFAPDGIHVSETAERRGLAAIEAEATLAYDAFGAKGFQFHPAHAADAHHDVVRFDWEVTPSRGGDAAATGMGLLVLGEDGRIRCDYEFEDPRRP